MNDNECKDCECYGGCARCEHIEISVFTVYWWIRKGGKSYAEQRLSKLT